jgi:nucleotide-binding universal stress UspA family protein
MMTRIQSGTPPPIARTAAPSGFARLLAGIDFGPASLAAARWATSYIAPNARILVAHVAPVPDPTAVSGTLPPAEVAGGIRGFATTLSGQSARSVLRVGSPSEWLSRLANDNDSSLLVLGRRAQASRTRIGEPNVIERSARRTTASVLVVPEGTSMPPGHVIAAVDDSSFTAAVIRVARRVARLHAIPLTVLHVVYPADGAYERVIRTARNVIAGTRHLRSRALEIVPGALPDRTIRWLARLSREEAADVDVDIALGDPAREIVGSAETRSRPLIVVGARGADLAPRGSLGSVARELLTRAPMPVLAVQEG